MKILFICTGNTCRSPMAAALAGKIFTKAGILVEPCSAGLYGAFDAAASRHAVSVMREEGLDITKHRAQTVSDLLLEEAAIVLTMTGTHKRQLLEDYPRHALKIHTLGEFEGSGRDVSDPYGGDEAEYRACADMIKEMLCGCIIKLH